MASESDNFTGRDVIEFVAVPRQSIVIHSLGKTGKFPHDQSNQLRLGLSESSGVRFSTGLEGEGNPQKSSTCTDLVIACFVEMVMGNRTSEHRCYCVSRINCRAWCVNRRYRKK